MFSVRPLQEEDAKEAVDVWAEAMRSYGGESLYKFVQTRLDDPQDMGDIWNGFLKGPDSGNRRFWVVEYTANIDEGETDDHLGPKSGKQNVLKHNSTSSGNSQHCIYVGGNAGSSYMHKNLYDEEVYKINKKKIVGCVGCFVRSAEDLARAIPKGKEYLKHELGYDNCEIQPLWAPVGVAGTLGDGYAAVELIRMAVHHDFRGRGVAELLVAAVSEYALSQKCAHVVLTTGTFMQKAVKAYRRLGFNGHAFPQFMVYAGKANELLKIKT